MRWQLESAQAKGRLKWIQLFKEETDRMGIFAESSVGFYDAAELFYREGLDPHTAAQSLKNMLNAFIELTPKGRK